MTGKEKDIVTQQVEGEEGAPGKWQARYKNGLPNDFQEGETEAEAREKLMKLSIETKAKHPNDPDVVKMTQKIEPHVNRLITKELKSPIVVNGEAATHVAYREDNPDVQHYGSSVTAAKSAFLNAERVKPKEKEPIFKD